jgi:hypothetical protein
MEMADMQGGFKQIHVLNLLRVKVEDMLNTQALMLSMMSDCQTECEKDPRDIGALAPHGMQEASFGTFRGCF